MSKIERIIQLAKAQGGQMAALARNYQSAKSSAHRQKILDAILANATSQMWLAWYSK